VARIGQRATPRTGRRQPTVDRDRPSLVAAFDAHDVSSPPRATRLSMLSSPLAAAYGLKALLRERLVGARIPRRLHREPIRPRLSAIRHRAWRAGRADDEVIGLDRVRVHTCPFRYRSPDQCAEPIRHIRPSKPKFLAQSPWRESTLK
jgi:hypothetical protein